MKGTLFAFSAVLLLAAQGARTRQLGLDEALDELAFADLRISAVTIDMAMYLGWYPEEKAMMREAAERARGDLEGVKAFLSALEVPAQIASLKNMAMEIADKLESIYAGIDEKGPAEIEASFKDFARLYSRFCSDFTKSLNEHRQGPKLPEGHDPLDEEVRLARSEGDRDVYRAALALMRGKQYRKAYERLESLAAGYRGTPFSDCLMLRMSDCLLAADTDLKGEGAPADPEGEGTKLLSRIVDGGGYSPVLGESFLKWRTMTQLSSHGMSNMSLIPNKEYNEKRRRMVQTIRGHLRASPGDEWARKQADYLLLGLPNIERGGLMGNANIAFWADLYAADGKAGGRQPGVSAPISP